MRFNIPSPKGPKGKYEWLVRLAEWNVRDIIRTNLVNGSPVMVSPRSPTRRLCRHPIGPIDAKLMATLGAITVVDVSHTTRAPQHGDLMVISWENGTSIESREYTIRLISPEYATAWCEARELHTQPKAANEPGHKLAAA